LLSRYCQRDLQCSTIYIHLIVFPPEYRIGKLPNMRQETLSKCQGRLRRTIKPLVRLARRQTISPQTRVLTRRRLATHSSERNFKGTNLLNAKLKKGSKRWSSDNNSKLERSAKTR